MSRLSSVRNFKRALAWLSIVGISSGPFSGGVTFAAPQKDSRCRTHYFFEQFCASAIWIGPERGKPFIAERTTKSLKSSQGEVQVLHEGKQFVARDAAGRIREEVQTRKATTLGGKLALGGIPSSHQDLNTSTTIVDDAEQLTVSIVDCFAGQAIQLTPETQQAIVQVSCSELPLVHQDGHSYFGWASQLIQKNLHSGATVEDLGFKTIDDIQSRGIKITLPGGEKDGEWAGKPVIVWEMWLSDELNAIILSDYSDLKEGVENRTRLVAIKREEPDSSLFVVPSGYKVDQWK